MRGASSRLRPGMNGGMDIIINKIPKAISIPAKALFTRAGKPIVYLQRGGRYQATEVKVLARNPDVIVDMGDMADTVGVTEEHKREVTSLWERLSSVAAVKQHRVYAVASDVYVVPGPRVVDAAKAFLEMLHPEARGEK